MATGGERDVGWMKATMQVQGSCTGGADPVGVGADSTSIAGNPVACSDLASSQIGQSPWPATSSALQSWPCGNAGSWQAQTDGWPACADAPANQCTWPLVTTPASGRTTSRTSARVMRIGLDMRPIWHQGAWGSREVGATLRGWLPRGAGNPARPGHPFPLLRARASRPLMEDSSCSGRKGLDRKASPGQHSQSRDMSRSL